VARCSIAISQAAAPTGRRSRSAAPAAATSWRPTEMAHRNCNAGVGSGVYVIAINLLFFYDRGRLFAPRQNNAATAGLSVVVGERLSASIRAGPRDSEIAPTGSNRRGNNAAKRNSRSPFRYSAWLLGGDLSRHGVLPVVRKQPPRAAQHRTTFFTTSLLTSARRGWTRGISATPLASCAVIPAPAPYSLSIVNFRSCSSAHHGVMCCAWLNYLLFCDLPVLFSRAHAKLILFSASLS